MLHYASAKAALATYTTGLAVGAGGADSQEAGDNAYSADP